MHELQVFVLDERHTVSTPDELADLMVARSEGANHFEIAPVDSLYPMLDLLVRDPYAVVHFWPHEGVAGDQADAGLAGAPEEVDFPHTRTGETITMPGSVLVDVDMAIACVEQFARTLTRPTLVGWIEL